MTSSEAEPETAVGTGSDATFDRSLQAIENCFRLLENLHVTDNLVETDSSDSDSESEPEMKYADPRKKKKKKSKKKRDLERMEKAPTKKDPDESKDTTTLPAISTQDVDEHNRQKPNAQKSIRTRTKSVPLFVSKFEGRHNNGIPCFSEERSMERAAKKYVERQKRLEEQRQREAEVYFLADGKQDGGAGSHEEEIRRRLALAVDGNAPNVTRAFLRWRSRCLRVQPMGEQPDYPMRLTSFQPTPPIDHNEERLGDSNPDSLVTESEYDDDDFDEDYMPPLRRQSLPTTNSPAYRFSLGNSSNTPLGGKQVRFETKSGLEHRRNSLGNVRKPSGAGSEELIRNMVVAPNSHTAPQTHQEAARPLASQSSDVISFLQSVTENANKVADLNQSEQSEFFMVNYRLGNGGKMASKVKDESSSVKADDAGSKVKDRQFKDEYGKRSKDESRNADIMKKETKEDNSEIDRQKYRKTEKTMEEVKVTERSRLTEAEPWKTPRGENVYCSRLVKPSAPLTHPAYVPPPQANLIADLATDKQSLIKLLRSRAKNVPLKSIPQQPEGHGEVMSSSSSADGLA